MATWNSDNIIITKKGEEVLSKVLAGIGKLTISRVVTGAGYVSPSKLYSQTQVSDIRQELDITNYSTTNEGTSLALRVSNKELESPYSLYQIGIYVTHPDFSEEVLYVIAQCDTDNPDIIPLPSETPVSLNYNFYLAHSGTSDVGITISDAGLVSVGEFESYKQEVTTELGKKATKEQGEKADTAVQAIKIGGIEQSKVGGVVNLPAYPTSLPANGGNADTLGNLPVNDFIRHLGMIDDVSFLNRTQDYSYEAWISATTAESLGLPSEVHIFRSFKVKPDDTTTSGGASDEGGTTHNFQLAISENGTTMSRLSVLGTMTGWGNWSNIADGCNAGLFSGNSIDKFLKYNGVATDCNECTTRGVYQATSSTLNTPSPFHLIDRTPILITFDGSFQLFFTGVELYSRAYCSEPMGATSPYWTDWKNVSDGGNADKIDGKHAADFALKTEIPTTLPANGGNADTLDGKHASDFTLSYIRNNKPLVTSILALETTVRLKWLPVDGATAYAVALYIDGKYVTQSTSITKTYYDIQDLTPGTVYLALVQAYVNDSWSTFTTDDLVHFYTMPVATATSDGLVTRSSQTFAGLKTFNNGIRSNVGVSIYISGSLKYPNAVHTNSGSADKDGFIIFGDTGAELQVKGTNIWRQATSISNRPELRNLASGTASANTTNCPSGAWYGKHS